MKRILLLSSVFLLCALQVVWAQERIVTGTVTGEEDGTPIPGVNVIVKGSAIGTVTDIEGRYQINVPGPEAVLTFSFIGLATEEVIVRNQSVIDMVMTVDIQQLTEVVVTAVGIEREAKALGYSVENVDGDKVQQVAEPDALRALQGKIPGVNIAGSGGAAGSATRITIRGNSSLLGNNQPLFVVDGVPYNNSSNNLFTNLGNGAANSSRIADLDPNNIASMTVLKGAAAAALYGTRAANGVVLITTKSGSAKATKKGLEITYNGSFGVETIANLPDYQNTYGTGTDFAYAQANGSWGAPFIGTRPYATRDSIPHWFSVTAPELTQYQGVNVPYRAYPDNVEELFETGTLFDNSISVNSGNQDAAINVTVSHSLNDGYVPNTKFERTSIAVGGRMELDNGFTVGGNLNYVKTAQDAVQSGVGALGGNNSSAFARALYLGRNWDIHGQPYQNPLDQGSLFMVGRGQADNPLWSYENAGYRDRTNRAVANLNIGYDITDWLNVTYKIGINAYNQRQKDFIRPGSTGPSSNPGIGQITTQDVSWEEIESNFLVTINKNFSDDFTFRAILGHNMNQRTRDAQAFQGQTYVIFDIDDIDNTNDVIPFGGDYSRRRIWGLFGDISLGYKDWAFLGITGRNDWSSTLPQQNNSFFYPAITASVVLSDALQVQSNFLSSLKLRGAWSEVGNDTDPYLLNPVYLINSSFSTTPQPTAELPFQATGASSSVPGATLSNVETDPNLKPERTSEVEGGLDLYLFDNRFGLNFTYYKRNSRDQIAFATLPSSTGFTSILTNFGEISNEGVEIGLDLTPVSTASGFTWNIFGAFTHNKNLVVELADGVEELVLTNGGSGASRFSASVYGALIPGQEYGLLKGTADARDQDGNLLIDPTTGEHIEDTELRIIGNPNPDFIVGITNTFTFKGFRLNAVLDWRQGGDLYSNTVLSMMGRGVTTDTEDREMNVILPGVYGDPNTLEPIRTDNGEKIPNQTMMDHNNLWFGQTFAINAANEWSVYDATVVRLREITLGYDLPSSLLETTPFSRASISLTGRNLWYNAPNFPEGTNYDPEVNQFGNSNLQGIEFSMTPTARRYAVSVSLTF